jgi:hypothetical protein
MQIWCFSQVLDLVILAGLVGRGPCPWMEIGMLFHTRESAPELLGAIPGFFVNTGRLSSIRMWWFPQVPNLVVLAGVVERGPCPWRLMGVLPTTGESLPDLFGGFPGLLF